MCQGYCGRSVGDSLMVNNRCYLSMMNKQVVSLQKHGLFLINKKRSGGVIITKKGVSNEKRLND